MSWVGSLLLNGCCKLRPRAQVQDLFAANAGNLNPGMQSRCREPMYSLLDESLLHRMNWSVGTADFHASNDKQYHNKDDPILAVDVDGSWWCGKWCEAVFVVGWKFAVEWVL